MSQQRTKADRTLWPNEVHKLKKIIDELDEQIDTRRELLSMVGRNACIEFLEEQMHKYGDDEQDEFFFSMAKLAQELKAG